MAMYFKNGFHTTPQKGSVEISDEQYQALLAGQQAGKMIADNGKGQPILVELPPSPHHQLINGKWELNHTKQQAVIFAEKSAKLAEINAQAQAFINQLAKYDETPPFERDTWSIQREEAKAWFADKDAPTPTLAVIAQMRGVPLTELRQKAYEKAVAYQTVAAIVAGQRQAYEDRLNAAETLEAVQGIEVAFSLPSTEGAE